MGNDITTTRDQQINSPDAIDQRLTYYAKMSQGAFSPNTLRAIASDTKILPGMVLRCRAILYLRVI